MLVDFVARDLRGRPVADLAADEIEVLEDGVPQRIRGLRRLAGNEAMDAALQPDKRPRTPDPARQIRLILLAFDQLSASGRALARTAVVDLMKRGIPPNTYITVVQLDPSFRIVQPFTDEPYLVKWAVERLTGARGTRPEGVPGIGQPTRKASGGDYAAAAMAQTLAGMEGRAAEMERERPGTGPAYGLLSMVLGLRRLEGRKTAILFSEGLSGAGAVLCLLIGQANHNNVAFYTVDARGLRPAAATPANSPSSAPVLEPAESPFLVQLATETRGVAAAGTNDLRIRLRQDVPSLSSILLVKRVDPSPPPESGSDPKDGCGPDPLRWPQGLVTPRMERITGDVMGFCFVAFAPPGQKPAAYAEILKDGSTIFRTKLEPEKDPKGNDPYLGTVSSGNLVPGDYELRILVFSGWAAAEEKADFEIIR